MGCASSISAGNPESTPHRPVPQKTIDTTPEMNAVVLQPQGRLSTTAQPRDTSPPSSLNGVSEQQQQQQQQQGACHVTIAGPEYNAHKTEVQTLPAKEGNASPTRPHPVVIHVVEEPRRVTPEKNHHQQHHSHNSHQGPHDSDGQPATPTTAISHSGTGIFSSPSRVVEKPFASVESASFQSEPSDTSTTSEPEAHAPPARYRSKSVVVLEKISLSRMQEEDDQPFEDMSAMSSSMCPEMDQSTRTQTTVVRTRRLSSIYNEFASSVETFLKSSDGGGGGTDDDDANENEYLRKIFTLLDLEGKGVVSEKNLTEGFRRMGHVKKLETVNTMFNCADENHDGVLSWSEFSKFFRHLHSIDFVASDDADIDAIPPPRPRARNYSTILVSMKSYRCRTLPSQAGRIKCVAMSQHRPLYAVSHRNDKNVHLYDMEGREQRVLTGHKDSLLGIAFSNDRKVAASVSRDSMLILWDCTVGHAVNTVQHPGIVTAVTFSYDGKTVYTGCQDNLVRRFTGTKCHLKAVLDRLPRAELGVTVALACQHHANKEIVFSRSCDKGAIVADASTLKITTVLEGHKSMVWQAQYRGDGTQVLTSCERYVKIWGTLGYTQLFSLDSERFSVDRNLVKNAKPKLWTTSSFCPAQFGPMIVAFNTDTNVVFVDCQSGNLVLSHNFRSSVYAAAMGIDSPTMICGDDWGNVYRFDLL